jgi:hypothetical protein
LKIANSTSAGRFLGVLLGLVADNAVRDPENDLENASAALLSAAPDSDA